MIFFLNVCLKCIDSIRRFEISANGGMSSGFRERYIHFHQFNNWGLYPSDCYPSAPCKKPYIAFPRPLLNNVWLRDDPTECPKKMQSITDMDFLRATDFRNMCWVSCKVWGIKNETFSKIDQQ